MLLYPDGGSYFGQISSFNKQGVGKLIKFSGSFYEGTWEQDKLMGPKCRIYDSGSQKTYTGSVTDGIKVGDGREYDAIKDEVYEGKFENNKY